MKLLYAEDEAALSEAIVDILTFHNFTVDPVYDGNSALDYARLGDYDGIILDIMMPGLSGLEVLKALRSEGCKTPIMLLTAKSDVEDRIAGLDAGADAYLPKPFSTAEMLAMVRAMLRRREGYSPDLMSFGDITLDRQSFELCRGDNRCMLPKLEYRIMELLMLNHGIFLSTEDILVKVWGYDTDAEPGTVWVYISYLRKRLAAMGSQVAITARRNIGYTLTFEKGGDE